MNLPVRLIIGAFLLAIVGGLPSSAQTPRVSKVMRVKLDHTQKILEAVVTSNWQQLDTESRALARLTQGPDWYVLRMPEYTRHSEAFVRATDELIQAASRRDLEAASLAFTSLTARCTSCHRYLARTRIASATTRAHLP
jgi:hypothetical protein